MISIVTPVFNDWTSLAVLLGELDEVASCLPERVSVVVVDDGSTSGPGDELPTAFRHLVAVEILELHCNLGHQRAIAIGVSACVAQGKSSSVVVMDCDGEDSPGDLIRLIEASARQPGSIVVATRARRSEGTAFRAFYQAYKLVFRLLTGKTINFGNYCLLPAAAARRLAYMPDTWNHLAASVVKSNMPLAPILSARGSRYAGMSSMSLVSLVVHGCSAISVFSDKVLTRLLLLVGVTTMAALASVLATILVRFLTDLAIPGWATTVVGFSTLLFFQSLSLLIVMVFINLNARSGLSFIPALQSGSFIASRRPLHPTPHGNV